jgi:hypothetical protein
VKTSLPLDVEANLETGREILIEFQEGMANSAADIVSLAVAFDPAIVVPHVRADHKRLDLK